MYIYICVRAVLHIHTNTIGTECNVSFKMAIHTKPGRCSPISNLWFQYVCIRTYVYINIRCIRGWLCAWLCLYVLLSMFNGVGVYEAVLYAQTVESCVFYSYAPFDITLHIGSTHYAHWINGNDGKEIETQIEMNNWKRKNFLSAYTKKNHVNDEHIIAPLAFNINKTARAGKKN